MNNVITTISKFAAILKQIADMIVNIGTRKTENNSHSLSAERAPNIAFENTNLLSYMYIV